MAASLIIKDIDPTRLYFTDLGHRAIQMPIKWTNNRCEVQLFDSTPIAVHAHLAVPGFGYTWATADNKGEGYTAGEIPLVEELARSRIARCERAADAYGIASSLEAAESELRKGAPMDAFAEALIAGEEIELTHARDVLERRNRAKHPGPTISATLFGERLGQYCIGVGPDWPADRIPDFLRPQEEWELLSRMCNGTIMPNFWRWIEYEKGCYRWKPLDRIVEFADRKGMVVKSMFIYWGGIGGTPPWFRKLGHEERKQAVEKWATDLVSRYKGSVAAWETVNEMHNWAFARSCLPPDQVLDMTKLVSDLVGDLDPGTPRVINNCCIWGDYVQDWSLGGPWCPLTYLKDATAARIEFEAIGLQYYSPGRDMMECIQHLDRFLRFGKEIHVTEMGTPSYSEPRGALETAHVDPNIGWRGPWSPERQAGWVESWYTLAASRPEVKLMNWWDFDDQGAFIAHAGLLDEKGRPKPAYDRLISLCKRYGMGRDS